jgi:hypothetical protein
VGRVAGGAGRTRSRPAPFAPLLLHVGRRFVPRPGRTSTRSPTASTSTRWTGNPRQRAEVLDLDTSVRPTGKNPVRMRPYARGPRGATIWTECRGHRGVGLEAHDIRRRDRRSGRVAGRWTSVKVPDTWFLRRAHLRCTPSNSPDALVVSAIALSRQRFVPADASPPAHLIGLSTGWLAHADSWNGRCGLKHQLSATTSDARGPWLHRHPRTRCLNRASA